MKFIGSKARLKKDVVPILQAIIDDGEFTNYIEPFVGGANMIDNIKCETKTGYDNNEYLISMWNELKDGWEIPNHISKEEYWSIKEDKEGYPKPLVSVAGFVATYNAKWFDGYAGIVETKTGTTRNYYDEGKRNIEKQLPNVMNVDFVHSNYKDIDVEDSLIYCDPPYKTKKTRRDLYGEEFNHEEYFDWVREMSKSNIVVCSEYEMPDDFVCIYEKGMQLHFDNRNLKERVERLFIHKSRLTKCVRCRGYLLPTPVDDYNSYCPECDEDFGWHYLSSTYRSL